MKVKNKKREMKAKEYAEKFNISVSTVKKYFSQDREDYEKEAKQRRLKAYVLRESGMKWQQVADSLGCSYHAAVALYKRYERLDLNEQENV
ncbi:plasmid replication protein [Salmonella enterica]|nr:plasmid replication protein [Salmonella enterica]ECB8351187.1 plasmid replication protein [Salmonella enterica subsp. enterica serovar Berta]EGQ8673360.1 plasmid replication protein [Vibrio cholerae]EBC0539325.1 plasmid replication protein [Salmonella enterica]EBK5174657.1 plasmid replication protein [Salmonella enterica]